MSKTKSPKKGTNKPKVVAVTKPMSALDAAFKVLEDAGTSLRIPAIIEAMAAKGYWSSPAGKTPAATLSSAIRREISVKGDQSRFRLADKGLFVATGNVAAS